MSYLGDYAAGGTIEFNFTTRQATGAPYELAGSPVVSIYKAGNTTEVTTGVTLTANYDSRTGLNNVSIDTSADGTFYSNGGQFTAVITAGTVNTVSVVGEVVGRFVLKKQPLTATVAGRELDVSAGGEAGLDWANVGSPTTAVDLSGTTIKTTQVVASVTGAVGSVTGAVGSVTGMTASDVGAIKAKTDLIPAAPAAVGDIPTANQNADALLDRAAGVETGYTLRQAMRLVLASLAGKLSGAATTSVSIRDVTDSKTRIAATVDADGNRTAFTYDVT